MRKWITFLIVLPFFFSITDGQGQTPQRQKNPNISIRKEVVKSSSAQKDFKDLSPARQEKLLADKEKREAKKVAKDEKLQKNTDPKKREKTDSQLIPFGNTYAKKNGVISKVTNVNRNLKASVSNVYPQKAIASQTKSTNVAGLFFEDFEGSPIEAPYTLPAGWTNIPTPGGNGWSTSVPGYSDGSVLPGHSGTRYANILYHSTVAHNAWAITPGIGLTAGKTYKISFWVYISGWGGSYERLEVKLGTSPAVADMSTSIYDNGETNLPEWSEISYIYTPATSGDYYIGFHSFSPADVNVTMFDDVKVEEIIMTAPAAPANFAVTPDAGGALSAELAWTNPSVTRAGEALTSLTSIVVERNGAVIHTIDNPAPIPGASLTWTDNTPEEGDYYTYTIYAVNSDGASDPVSQTVYVGVEPCSIPLSVANGYSEGFEDINKLDCWMIYNMNGDYTYWDINSVPAYTHSGDYSLAYISSWYDDGQDDWVVTPLIGVPATGVFELSFWSYNLYPADYGKNSVLISTGSRNPADFTEIWSPASVTNAWVETRLDLTAYKGQNIYIAFRYEGDAYRHNWYIDDLAISELHDYDAGVTGITQLVSGILTNSENITVKVKNFGSQALTNVPVKVVVDDRTPVSGTISSIAVRAEVEYTFPNVDLSIAKTYSIKAYTELSADGNNANDTAAVSVTNVGDCLISTLPYNEGVESDVSLLCWKIFDYDSSKESTWYINTYEYHSGGRSIYHNYGPGGDRQDGWLVSPKITIPNDEEALYTLSFWSENGFPDFYDKNSVLISTGSSNPEDGVFEEVWSPTTVGFAWEEAKINLNAYKGRDIYIAFRYQGNNAHSWYLDDLTVEKIVGDNVGVTAITYPLPGSLGDSEPVTIKVKNDGSKALANVPVKVVINNGTPISGRVPSIGIFEEVEYTFPPIFDLSVAQTYTIQAYTDLKSDTDRSNDTTTVSVINVGDCAVSTFPYEEGVEDDLKLLCWHDFYYDADGAGTGWSVTTDPVHSGTRSVVHTFDYDPQDGWLVSPEIKIPSSGVYRLSLWSYNLYPADYGKNSVLISTGSGDPAGGGFVEIWSPKSVSSEWVETKINLADYAGETIHIAFRYEGTFAHVWYLDDLKIEEITGADIGVTAISNPKSGPNLTATEPVIVKVKNFGAEAAGNFSISVQVDDETPISVNVPASVGINKEVEFTLEGITLDLSAVKTYTIKAYTSYSGDTDLSNDTTTLIVNNDGNVAVMGSITSITSCDISFADDGKDEAYSPGLNETQTITFYPATPGDKVEAEFTAFASYPWAIVNMWGFLIEYPGDTLFVYNGHTADESQLIDALTGDLNAGLPKPFRSWASDGSLTFVFKKHSEMPEAGWEANIGCYTPFTDDAGVDRILSPLEGGEAAGQVKVRITNFGVNPIASMNVAYTLNDGAPVTEAFNGNLAAGASAEFTFAQTVDLSTAGDYILKAYTLLSNDGYAANDTTAVKFTYKAVVTLYGYRIYDDSFTSLNDISAVSFKSNNPSQVTTISGYKDGTNSIGAGAYADGYIYAYSFSMDDYGEYPENFIKLTGDWTEVLKTSATSLPADMTYDYSTGTLYAISYSSETGLLLQTVNPETGVLTTVTPVTEYLYTLAADLTGNLYGVDSYGNLVTINNTTGAVTIIGNTGIEPYYGQSMTFDHNTGRLFWAMCNSFDDGRLIELDPATGAATDLGILGENSQVLGLYTIYNPSAAPELLGINIADNAANVEPDLDIVLTFDRNITSSDLSGITLTKNGTAETAMLTPSITGSVLTIAHEKLASETLYNLLLPAGTIDNYGADIALSFTIKQYTAIPGVNDRPFSVFPNPAKNVVYVSYVPENSIISILDLTGRVIKNKQAAKSENNVRLDLNLASGVYFIRIENNNVKTLQKLIIK